MTYILDFCTIIGFILSALTLIFSLRINQKINNAFDKDDFHKNSDKTIGRYKQFVDKINSSPDDPELSSLLEEIKELNHVILETYNFIKKNHKITRAFTEISIVTVESFRSNPKLKVQLINNIQTIKINLEKENRQ